MRRLPILATALLVSASGVRADVPNIVVDIPPVFSLVSSVMQGVGTPKLLLRGNESPHNFALRPSQRRDLGQADIIFWIGEGLTPWLEKSTSLSYTDAYLGGLGQTNRRGSIIISRRGLF